MNNSILSDHIGWLLLRWPLNKFCCSGDGVSRFLARDGIQFWEVSWYAIFDLTFVGGWYDEDQAVWRC